MARVLKQHGVDLLLPLAGQTVVDEQPAYGAGFLTPLSELIRHEAGLPTVVGGYLTTTGEVNSILAAGRADVCVMTGK
jgi:anthraniloyl-CoA monooxygenase